MGMEITGIRDIFLIFGRWCYQDSYGDRAIFNKMAPVFFLGSFLLLSTGIGFRDVAQPGSALF
jgi:hypothetical protein